MCWISEYTPYKKTVEKTIIVYKYLTKDLESPIQFYQYIRDKKVPKEILSPIMGKKGKSNFWYILTGYHSCQNIDSAKNYFDECLLNSYVDGCKLYKCIIPKGAIYYKNEYGHIVSNTIVVKRKCFNLFGFLF